MMTMINTRSILLSLTFGVALFIGCKDPDPEPEVLACSGECECIPEENTCSCLGGTDCVIDGETVQSGRTSDLIFPVDELIAWISRICTLEPGDLIFTGTPSGVGQGRTPPRFLRPGMVVETAIEGVGSMRNPVVAAPAYA